jgi:hypothetical protein
LIEFLLSAARSLTPGIVVGLSPGTGMIAQAARMAAIDFPGARTIRRNPSLFVGIAGIGYEMLRLAYQIGCHRPTFE